MDSDIIYNVMKSNTRKPSIIRKKGSTKFIVTHTNPSKTSKDNLCTLQISPEESIIQRAKSDIENNDQPQLAQVDQKLLVTELKKSTAATDKISSLKRKSNQLSTELRKIIKRDIFD